MFQTCLFPDAQTFPSPPEACLQLPGPWQCPLYFLLFPGVCQVAPAYPRDGGAVLKLDSTTEMASGSEHPFS